MNREELPGGRVRLYGIENRCCKVCFVGCPHIEIERTPGGHINHCTNKSDNAIMRRKVRGKDLGLRSVNLCRNGFRPVVRRGR